LSSFCLVGKRSTTKNLRKKVSKDGQFVETKENPGNRRLVGGGTKYERDNHQEVVEGTIALHEGCRKRE